MLLMLFISQIPETKAFYSFGGKTCLFLVNKMKNISLKLPIKLSVMTIILMYNFFFRAFSC